MDIERLKYDLAMTYAKSKLDYALAAKTIDSSYEPQHPSFLDEISYLLSEFKTAYYELDNYENSAFLDEKE